MKGCRRVTAMRKAADRTSLLTQITMKKRLGNSLKSVVQAGSEESLPASGDARTVFLDVMSATPPATPTDEYTECIKVSCPWLTDAEVAQTVKIAREKGVPPLTRQSNYKEFIEFCDFLREHVNVKGNLEELVNRANNISETNIRDFGRLIEWYRLPPPPETPPKIPSHAEGTRAEHLDAAMATVPKDAAYDEQASQIEGLIGSVRQRAAARLLPALKDEMRERDHDTYDQKVELVRWVKAELRRFDLAIKHPKTGQPATLNTKPGNDPDIGSFELASRDAAGREKTFTTPDLDTLLDKLELMDAPPRREALAEWNEKVGRQRGGAKRG